MVPCALNHYILAMMRYYFPGKHGHLGGSFSVDKLMRLLSAHTEICVIILVLVGHYLACQRTEVCPQDVPLWSDCRHLESRGMKRKQDQMFKKGSKNNCSFIINTNQNVYPDKKFLQTTSKAFQYFIFHYLCL